MCMSFYYYVHLNANITLIELGILLCKASEIVKPELPARYFTSCYYDANVNTRCREEQFFDNYPVRTTYPFHIVIYTCTP
jgi:hypothetical protein